MYGNNINVLTGFWTKSKI